MHHDANGVAITLGCRVKHIYEPLPAAEASKPGNGHCAHNFSGVSEVVEIMGHCVRVKPTNRGHLPVHLPEMLQVVG